MDLYATIGRPTLGPCSRMEYGTTPRLCSLRKANEASEVWTRFVLPHERMDVFDKVGLVTELLREGQDGDTLR